LKLHDLHKQTFVTYNSSNLLAINTRNKIKQEKIDINYVYQGNLPACYKIAELCNYLIFCSSITARYHQFLSKRSFIPLDEKELSIPYYVSYKKHNINKVDFFLK